MSRRCKVEPWHHGIDVIRHFIVDWTKPRRCTGPPDPLAVNLKKSRYAVQYNRFALTNIYLRYIVTIHDRLYSRA